MRQRNQPPREEGASASIAGPAVTRDQGRHLAYLWVLFFVSGFCALTYQVAWQRLLFAVIGVDLESVTVIVSTFMLGLGVGALLGGQVADRWSGNLILFFVAAEAGIGLFGLGSPYMIGFTGEALVGASTAVTATACFALLLVPTTLMGSTLPLLVAHVFRIWRNIGVSTGQLYFSNTLGAAAGALLSSVIFIWLDLYEAIFLAASLNLIVAFTAWKVLGDGQ